LARTAKPLSARPCARRPTRKGRDTPTYPSGAARAVALRALYAVKQAC
jgi:hypothetical protein